MLVELRSNPVKYIEIRNFLEDSVLKRWFTHLQALPTSQGDVVTPAGRYTVNSVKRNQNCWLTPPNAIADEFRVLAWSQPIRQALRAMNDYLFLAHATVDEGSFLYSIYEQGNYYEWHRDRTPYLTFNLVLESAIKGGEFELSLDTQEPYKTAETLANTDNTLIIFPSFLLHRVKPVVQGQRQTLQYFLNASHTASQ